MSRDTKITYALGLSLAALLIVLDIIGIINLTY
jgi:hypothetical protein